jgi:ribonucleotide reductase beta subunit family protein with ferritin-like domain
LFKFYQNPDPHSSKMLDPYPDPHTTNVDPKHGSESKLFSDSVHAKTFGFGSTTICNQNKATIFKNIKECSELEPKLKFL